MCIEIGVQFLFAKLLIRKAFPILFNDNRLYGALLGVVLSFMMSVTTLSLPSMIMLRKAVKPKLLGILLAFVHWELSL